MPAANGQYGLVLNHDILAMLFDFYEGYERKAIISLMRTCHYMYSAGIPKLLSDTVRFDSFRHRTRKFASFSDFILADPQSRAKHIRDISLFGSELPDGQELRRFTHVLQCAVNLERFAMMCDGEHSESSIVAALAGSKSIKRVDLRILSAECTALVPKWKAPVTHARLVIDAFLLEVDDTLHVDELDAFCDPTCVLSAFSQTLQSMSVSYPGSFSIGPTFPVMKDLQIHAARNVAIYEIMIAFPNLTALSVDQEHVFLEPTELEEERQLNMQRNGTSCWRSLETLHGNLETLYSYALTCHVRHLSVVSSGRTNQNPDPTRFSSLLQATTSSRIDLNIMCRVEVSTALLSTLSVVQDYVTALQVKYDITAVEFDVVNFIDTCTDAFCVLRTLKDLTFSVKYTSRSRVWLDLDSDGEDSGPVNIPLDLVETSLHDFDAKAFVSQLSQRIPTLHTVSLDFSSNGHYSFKISEKDQEEREIILTAERRI